MFKEKTLKYGTTTWNGIKLALIEQPFLDTDMFGDLFFYADAVDVDGNLWYVKWQAIRDVNGNYVYNLDCPHYAILTEEWY